MKNERPDGWPLRVEIPGPSPIWERLKPPMLTFVVVAIVGILASVFSRAASLKVNLIIAAVIAVIVFFINEA